MRFACRLPTSLSRAVEPGPPDPLPTVLAPVPLCQEPPTPPTVPRASSRGSSRDFPCASTHHVPPDLGSHGQLDADRLVHPLRQSAGRTGTREGWGQLGWGAGSADLTLEHVEGKAKGVRGGLGETWEKETSGELGLPLCLPGGRLALLAEPSPWAGAMEGPGGPEGPSLPDRASQGSVCPGEVCRLMAAPLSRRTIAPAQQEPSCHPRRLSSCLPSLH